LIAVDRPTVAILGASHDRTKFGNKSLRAHLAKGYDVYPVNPKGGRIEGLTVYEDLLRVPVEHLDRISMYLPPHLGLTVLGQVAKKGCGQLWLNPGTSSPELVQRARALGINIVEACSIVDLGINPASL
jgi:hypothetical protein